MHNIILQLLGLEQRNLQKNTYYFLHIYCILFFIITHNSNARTISGAATPRPLYNHVARVNCATASPIFEAAS